MHGELRNWQFSLRAMFGLTTICALLLSLNAQHPGTLWVVGASVLIGAGILLLQLVWVGLLGGATFVGELVLEKILRWSHRPNDAPAEGIKRTSDT